jgi:Na+/H+-dicarboxylate symporter
VLPVLAAAAVVILLTRTLNERDALPEREYNAFMCIWVLPVLGMAVQTLYYGISLSNICNSIAVIIMTTVFIREIIEGISVRRSFILNGESVERISGDLDAFLKGTGTDRQNRIRIRFTVEEALISIWRRFGDLNMVKVIASIRFGRPSIRIEHVGDAYNPFSKTKSSVDDWSTGLLASAGISPMYSYSHGTNIMRIPMRRMSINPVIVVIFAIVFGIIAGSVAMVTLSEGDAQYVTNGLLMPVYDLWNNILYSVSAPAMLIIVMSTMLDTQDVSDQGGNAGAITGRYFIISLVLGVITIVAAVLMTGHNFAYEGFSRNTLSDLLRSFFSVIPENMLDPIRDFNTAQLILMGIIFAYATMAVGQQASGIASLIHELNLLSMQLAQWIAGLMPAFTVFLTAQLMISHNAQLLTSLLVVIPFSLIVSLVIMAGMLLYVSNRFEVKPAVLLHKLWPSFILTLKNGLDSDSYALAEKACTKSFGIQKIFTQKMLPLGLVLYMPASIIGMISFVIFAALNSGVAITPVWILKAIVFALILLVAAPPIPGVNLLSYVVIIGQLGIGKEYVIAAMIFDILFNAFASAANLFMLHFDMILQAEHMGLLNRSVLSRDDAA